MKLFENSQDSDRIEVCVDENLSDERRDAVWTKLCRSFKDREDDDLTVFTTIKSFRKYLDEQDEDIDNYEIFIDGDIIYDKYALVYDTDVEY